MDQKHKPHTLGLKQSQKNMDKEKNKIKNKINK